jgi:hypothetical protein
VSKTKSHHGNEESEEEVAAAVEENSEDDRSDETLQSFEARINLFVHIHFARSSSAKRDDYKDGLVYQARKDLTLEFLKSTILKKCQNEGCCA